MQTLNAELTVSASAPRFYWLRATGAAFALASMAAFMATGTVECSFAKLTHLPCPGCGSTRAARALIALDFRSALRLNPVAPFVMLLIAMVAARGVWLVGRNGNLGHLGTSRLDALLMRGLVVALTLESVAWLLRFFGLFGGPVPV